MSEATSSTREMMSGISRMMLMTMVKMMASRQWIRPAAMGVWDQKMWTGETTSSVDQMRID